MTKKNELHVVKVCITVHATDRKDAIEKIRSCLTKRLPGLSYYVSDAGPDPKGRENK